MPDEDIGGFYVQVNDLLPVQIVQRFYNLCKGEEETGNEITHQLVLMISLFQLKFSYNIVQSPAQPHSVQCRPDI